MKYEATFTLEGHQPHAYAISTPDLKQALTHAERFAKRYTPAGKSSAWTVSLNGEQKGSGSVS